MRLSNADKRKCRELLEKCTSEKQLRMVIEELAKHGISLADLEDDPELERELVRVRGR